MAHLMGLGPQADVSLAEAREAAAAARKLVRQGTDPIARRRTERIAAAGRAGLNTFAEVAEAYIAAHEASWRNTMHRQQWRNSLDTYVHPVIGNLGVAIIDTDAVMRVLEPIWHEKSETASRLRGRIEAVLDYAAARGWRSGDNPARWRGHIDNLLPSRAKIARVEHHAALPWQDTAGFLAALRQQKGVGALALEFVILTAARTGEVVGATWQEIDRQAALWTVPAARMKVGREHRVPLSDAAMAVLEAAAPLRGNEGAALAFPGRRRGQPLSSRGMASLLERMKRTDLTVHGFRSTFRDWAGETGQPADLAEAALAHTLGNKVQTAYQRGDLLDRRRRLMADWAAFCGGAPRQG
jgi:integrase